MNEIEIAKLLCGTGSMTITKTENPKMKLYIAGPMTGIEELNFPPFHAAASELRKAGYEVVNPAEINSDPGTPWEVCMKLDLKAMLDCDGVVVLQGWQNSRDALIEVALANWINMPITTLTEAVCAAKWGRKFESAKKVL